MPLFFWLLACGMPAAAQSPGGPTFEVVPAWEAYYRPGSGTELSLRAAAHEGGALSVEIRSGKVTTRLDRRIEPGVMLVLPVPLRPSASEITIEARFGVGEPIQKQLTLSEIEAPLLALVADNSFDLSPWLVSDADFQPMPVGVADLPRTAAGYEAIAGLVIGRNVVGALDSAQREALNAYLQDCGSVFVLEDAAAQNFASAAGCGGRFVTRVDGPADAGPPLSETPPALPSYSELRDLLRGPPRLAYVAAGFLGLYVVLLTAVAFRRRRAGWTFPLALPIVASLLMLLVWYRNGPESRLLVWLDQENDEPARYHAVLDVYSQGIRDIELPLAARLGLPVPLSDRPIEYRPGDGDGRGGGIGNGDADDYSNVDQVSWQPSLFERQTLGVSGSSAAASDVAIGRDTVTPIVTNTGREPSSEAILVNERNYYRVPSLAPGASWSPDAATPRLARADFPAPLARIPGPAVLVPLAADAFPADLPRADRETGWIVHRLAAGARP